MCIYTPVNTVDKFEKKIVYILMAPNTHIKLVLNHDLDFNDCDVTIDMPNDYNCSNNDVGE